MSSRGYDEEIASIDARIEQLRARRRDEVARRGQAERRAYNHACHALGEMVIGASGRDWRELEYAALDRLLRAALASAGSSVTAGSATGTREATVRLRAWEREYREWTPAAPMAASDSTTEDPGARECL